MADPLSVAAGVTGIIGVALQITKMMVQFGLDWKDTPKDIRMFLVELEGLRTVLLRTSDYIRANPDSVKAIQNQPPAVLAQLGPTDWAQGDLVDMVAVCSAELEALSSELNKRAKGGRVGWERLKGPFLAKNIRNSVNRLRYYCQNLNFVVSFDMAKMEAATHLEVKEIRREQREWREAEENREVLNWLSRLTFSDKQRDTLSTRHPGTGKWLLELDEFKRWRDGDGTEHSLLWCPGIREWNFNPALWLLTKMWLAGAGKTVTTSIVIDHLKTTCTDKQAAFAFVYCDYKDQRSQTVSTLISSLVRQLVEQHSAIPSEVRGAYVDHGNGNQSLSTNEYIRLLLSLSSHFQRTFILVDALDECSDDSSEDQSDQQLFLEALLKFRQGYNGYQQCRVLITSRENVRIEGQLGKYSRIQIRATNQDIESYVRSRTIDSARFIFAEEVKQNMDLGQKIIGKPLENSQGMFLLPRLHLDHLERQTNVRGLRRALEKLPAKLDQIYDNAMERVKGQDEEYCKLAMQVLLWIMHALQPLQVEEIQHALAIGPGDEDLDEEGLSPRNLLVSVCAGLVSVDDESGTIRLVHFTIKEYLEKNRNRWFPDAESTVTQSCLTYLLYDVFAAGPCSDLDDWQEHYPFLVYAAQNWGIHARQVEWKAKELIVKFLEDELKLSNAIQARDLRPHTWRGFDENLGGDATGLHVAAAFGLDQTAGLLLNRGADIAARDDKGWAALHYASSEGHDTMVRLLAEKGANVNATTNVGETALMWAAWHSLESTVQTLLDVGADVDVEDRHGTVLHRAAYVGHESILRLLLGKATNVMGRTEDGLTALHRAAEGREDAILPLLIKNNPDGYVNLTDSSGLTALSLAVRQNDLEAVQFLVSQGTDVNVATNSGKTALDLALELASSSIIEVLVGQNAHPKLAWEVGSATVQQWAKHQWYPDLAKILTVTQADTSATDLPMVTKSREELIVVDRNSEDEPYLEIIIPPTSTVPVSRIMFRTESHDQGMHSLSSSAITDNPEWYDYWVGTYVASRTWFEAGVNRAGNGGDHPRRSIQENVYASETFRTHTNVWDRQNGGSHLWLDELQPGDVIQVYAKAGGSGWKNYVKRVEVSIY